MSKTRILIVEDEMIVAEDLACKLGQLGYEISGTTRYGEDAIIHARELRPDLVLMDIQLAGTMNGIEAAGIIGREYDLPVIYLTAHSDRVTLEQAKVTESFGYLLKPFDDRVLGIHIEMALYKHQAERKLRQAHDELESELAGVREELSISEENVESARQLALLDPLTGLPNRASFEQGLEQGLIQAKRHGWAVALLFLDIDKFKEFNDSYGHLIGDQVLLMVANRLKSAVRAADMVARWAGDEFVCLLLEVNQDDDVTRLAELLVNRIAEPFEIDGSVLSITVSIGIAMYPEDAETQDILFEKADAAMYEAKGTKKRVVLFGTIPH